MIYFENLTEDAYELYFEFYEEVICAQFEESITDLEEEREEPYFFI